MASYGAVPTNPDPAVEDEVESLRREEAMRRGRRAAAVIGLAGALVVACVLSFVHLPTSRTASPAMRTSIENMAEDEGKDAFLEPPRVIADASAEYVDVHLELGVSRIQVGDVSMHMRSFNHDFPAPTIVVRRGQTLRVMLWNKLESDANAGQAMNAFRRPNTTVLHTHGLHVSPVDSDNIYRSIEPGMHAHFIYPIPKNHPIGTFWLHPHYHGSTTLQSAYGAFAALLVEDEEPSSSKTASDVEVDEDHVMLVGWVDVGSGKRTDILEDERLSGSAMDVSLKPKGYASNGGFLAVNGRPNSTLTMRVGELHRWRIVNAVVDGVLRIVIEDDQACSVAEIAADGITYEAPRQVSSKHGVLIAPGSRRDLLIRCIEDTMVRSVLDADRGGVDEKILRYLGNGTNIAAGEVVRINVHGKTSNGSSKLESARSGVNLGSESGNTAEPLKDLREHEPAVRKVVEYTQGGPSTPKIEREGNKYTFYGINGQPYSPEIATLTVKLDQVVEWTIRNENCLDGSPALESHPFHLHTNHFQIVNVSSPNTGDYSPDFAVGDWRDTIAVPAPGNVTIRWVARDFTGPDARVNMSIGMGMGMGTGMSVDL
ncbi:Laccase-1 [Hondaea fermentalgiana]|uniref:Laccase-1 n=1 Tax=Hondaea fermentalgiana TaxID=2315210 RepID=A0A2R5GV79_9STRA|nr:Laccase-1 [Hondaea fermentalgiana]|eukprot:GBG34229.1 Laccase-1 [Hondaea fermentalgiana]